MSTNFQEESTENMSVVKQIQLYTKHWKWFILSVLFAIVLAFVYFRYATPQYATVSTILINDPSEGRGLSELAAFSDLGAFSGMASNDIDDEVDILKSKTLISKVVQDLNVNVSQFLIGNLKNTNIYKISPIIIKYDWGVDPYEDQEKAPKSFEFFLSKKSYKFVDLNEKVEFTAKYGDTLNFDGEKLFVDKSKYFHSNFKKEENEKIEKLLVSILPISKYAEQLQRSISVSPKSQRSSILDIRLKSVNKVRAQDILDRLVYQYNKQAVEDKNLVSLNTSSFIADRLEIISRELDEVEFEKANFKKQNQLTDLQTEAGLVVEQSGRNQEKVLEIETQIELTDSMIEYLTNKRSSDLVPANIGIDNFLVNEQISKYNQSVLERDKLLDVSTPLNPLVVNLNADINSQKLNLLESLKNQKTNLQIAKKDFNRQKGRIRSKISNMPQQEKSFRAIERKQTIKETLYLFLLEKREEASISTAVTAPVAKVIDRAYSTAKPISPKKKNILFVSVILGFLLPFSIIYIKDLLDTKISDKQDITNHLGSSTSILAEIPKIKRGEPDLLAINDRSVLGESFRILRTNLSYFSRSKHKEGKALRIFVTSTVKGEGKTFISFNTILALAATSKKVLVVGADIRNPQLHRYLKNNKNQQGLSDYLYNDDLTFDDVITTTDFNGQTIDYVTSGPIPPNPSELLMNGRLETLLEEAEDSYDYIIVDTAPTMLVTDTLLLTESADVTIYVVRADYTEKELLNFVKEITEQNKIKNPAIVLNDVDQDKVGYGYGYGYGAEKKSFFQRVFKG